eukprot:TRINITY_DN2279_c0_g2_i2.p1 TRINITY_DN2279_c0_g2~~TRINITY_DN2279_c0_g2_i2.p1  ORF type:complete len:297 (+),score=35.65 TRINITY_DN2279_c0_g2_i2:35-925(+)
MGCQTSTDSKSSKSAKKRKEESQSTSESPDKENPIEPKIAVLAENSPNNSRTPSKEKADLIWIKMQPTVCSICNKESTLFSPFSKSNELVCSKCAGPLPESDVKADYLRANAGKAKAGSSTNTPLKNRANDRLKTPVINSSNKEQSAVPNVRKPSSARQTPLKGMNIKRCNPGDHVLQVQRVLHKKECEICKEAEGLVCRRCQYLICQKCNKSLLTGGKAVKKATICRKGSISNRNKHSEGRQCASARQGGAEDSAARDEQFAERPSKEERGYASGSFRGYCSHKRCVQVSEKPPI